MFHRKKNYRGKINEIINFIEANGQIYYLIHPNEIQKWYSICEYFNSQKNYFAQMWSNKYLMNYYKIKIERKHTI